MALPAGIRRELARGTHTPAVLHATPFVRVIVTAEATVRGTPMGCPALFALYRASTPW